MSPSTGALYITQNYLLFYNENTLLILITTKVTLLHYKSVCGIILSIIKSINTIIYSDCNLELGL